MLWGSASRRFIPAPAGNIMVRARTLVRISVHPRACGEHGFVGFGGIAHVGSSPRLRGTSDRNARKYQHPRFIPAPAGNISSRFQALLTYPVHPRACGEH